MLKDGVEQSPHVGLYIKETKYIIDVITKHIQEIWQSNKGLKTLETVLVKMPNETKLIEIKKAPLLRLSPVPSSHLDNANIQL